MKTGLSILIHLLIVQCLLHACDSYHFDFFYFVLEWPGSRCNRKSGCCYPETGKPRADFIINGLHPSNKHTVPIFCDPASTIDQDEFLKLRNDMQENWPPLDCPTKDSILNWSLQWKKHGTCALPVINQHQYFKIALNLKNKISLLQSLKERGNEPNGEYYSLEKITSTIEDVAQRVPQMFCNKDKDGNHQLYRIRLCVNTAGSEFIQCRPMNSSCPPNIKFPSF